MDSFRSAPGRDAYATIRGFVYQVERTIPGLAQSTRRTRSSPVRPERISTMYGGLSGSRRRQRDRIVCWNRSSIDTTGHLSLRSHIVVQAIANYIRARRANPGLDVRFRFFTNAQPTTERQAEFPPGLGGIKAWNALREGTLRGEEASGAVRSRKRARRKPANTLAFSGWPPEMTTSASAIASEIAPRSSRSEAWTTSTFTACNAACVSLFGSSSIPAAMATRPGRPQWPGCQRASSLMRWTSPSPLTPLPPRGGRGAAPLLPAWGKGPGDGGRRRQWTRHSSRTPP